MSIELELIQAMSVRENYEKFSDHVNHNRLMKDSAILLKDFGKWFKLHPDDDQINYDSFITHFAQDWHKKDLDDDDIKYFNEKVFPVLKETQDIDCTKTLLSLYEKQTSDLIMENLDDIDMINELVGKNQEYRQMLCPEEVNKLGVTIEDLDLEEEHGNIEWCSPQIQRINGNIKLGDFVIVAAYANVGKGAFCIHQAATTIRQNKGPVLYFTSEDPIKKLYGRLLSNVYSEECEDGFQEIMANMAKYTKKFSLEFGADAFRAFDLDFGAMAHIKKMVDIFKPNLVIIDMADTLCPEHEDANTIKRVYDNLRQIANKKCPLIATSQANNTAYWDEKEGKMKNKKWLKMTDLYNSKVGKPAAATTIIGIAEDADKENIRYIHTPKNKDYEKVYATCELSKKHSMYKELI